MKSRSDRNLPRALIPTRSYHCTLKMLVVGSLLFVRCEQMPVVGVKLFSHRIYPVEKMNNTHTTVLTVAFVLRLKPQGEGVILILFPKLKLGANYFISVVGSLLFVSLRTNRDSPLIRPSYYKKKSSQNDKESFSMCVKKDAR